MNGLLSGRQDDGFDDDQNLTFVKTMTSLVGSFFAGISAAKQLDSPASPSPSPSDGQQIAMASYINPLEDPDAWARLVEYDSGKVSVLVANILNGPDYNVEPSWKSVIDKAASSGKKIIGYVRTGYLGVSEQKFTTRLGSNDLADWASQIEQDVDKWYELYGQSISGIFFDEGWPECGPDNIYSNLYAHINNYTKRKYPGAFTVLNPGAATAQCYENTMDTLITFESSYEVYSANYKPNDWTPKDPRKIWHIIYDVPQDRIEEVAALAKSRHAGLVGITDDAHPNPFDNLPNDAYMKTLMDTVEGGEPYVADPTSFDGEYIRGLPEDVHVVASDYSSVTLGWTEGDDSHGYAVYLDDELILELPVGMNRATVGMIEPGSSDLSFEVRTRTVGAKGGESTLVTASTKSLPESGAISNLTRKKDGDALIITADVLVPYAFVRLFLSSEGDPFSPGSLTGWPLEFATRSGETGVFNYLVEGNDFYANLFSYTGTWSLGSTANAEWTWAAEHHLVSQTQKGYTYMWTIVWPEADGEIDLAVQGQGYAPLTNVMID